MYDHHSAEARHGSTSHVSACKQKKSALSDARIFKPSMEPKSSAVLGQVFEFADSKQKDEQL